MRAVVVAGLVLLAGAMLPVLAVGLTLASLPPLDVSRAQRQSPVVTAREGEWLNVFLAEDDRWRLRTTPAMVSPRYIEALLAIEDRYFHWHPGVNPLAILRAAVQWLRTGRVVSGGSTLTMQVARLLEPRPRTLGSKWIEMVRALELEWRYSKDEILTFYLTLLPMGGNLESLRAASHRYLDTDPLQLSLADVAVLLAIPQSPEQRRPDRNPEITRAAAQAVAKRLIDRGLFAPQDVDELARLPLADPRPFPTHAWHLAQRLVGESGLAAAGEIRSTLDYRLQRNLEQKLEAFRPMLGPRQNVAAVILDAPTGELLAHAGSLGLDSDSGFLDLSRALRSPGSALKPFIYGMAMDDGLITDQTILDDRPTRFGAYAPANFEGGHQGPVRAGVALQASLNVPAVEVLDRLGARLFLNAWARAGLDYRLPPDADPSVAVALGAVGVRLLDLAQAYAALANEGRVPALRIRYDPSDTGLQPALLTPASARRLTSILAAAPMVDGRLHRAGSDGGPVPAFKTGTSYGYRDSWALGTVGRHVVGVWTGRPDGAPVPGATGRSLALRLALDLADQLPAATGPEPWVALPIRPDDLTLPTPQVLWPEPDSDLLVQLPPHPGRSIELRLSASSPTLALYLNGEPLERLDTLPVPHNGSYGIEVYSGDVRVQTLEFTVMSTVP